MRSAVDCGDIDTVAAISGGVVAAGTGASGIPADWTAGLLEWPRSPRWIERLAGAVSEATTTSRLVWPPVVGPLVVARNLLFLAGVVLHLLRRALPPY